MSVLKEKATIIDDKKRRHRIEVYAIGPNNTLLACSRGHDSYPELPGGAVDMGESDTEAGERELEEETGWVVKELAVLPVGAYRIFTGPEDSWFTRDGWQEEENIAIVCEALQYAPKEHHEKNGMTFKLQPIRKIMEETERALEKGMPLRKSHHAHFRLAALKESMGLKNAAHRPTWLKW